ncbi:hypothetical protein [Pacificimonas flava]|uniref:Uncharacterized protein n=1 Tax=Pacificimonas flava TaxID=1234595 RepID=M2TAD6_9SPHN|nr:hypothetical protein [Pacificimonas flava]EMD83554.1 hypothetical protein C725_1455 [Pacificimonas flava]MBB5278895.1 hypothetical protein [Pacificimonas flava]
MSQDVLHDFDGLRVGAAPIAGPGHNGGPALSSVRAAGAVPLPILLVFAGSFLVLLLALAMPAMGAASFPLLFAIFAVCFAAYFGGGLISPIGQEARQRRSHAPVASGDGQLSAREAAWQILPLPMLLMGFGLFAVAAKALIFA